MSGSIITTCLGVYFVMDNTMITVEKTLPNEEVLIKKCNGIYNKFFKRILDFTLALILLLLIWPVYFILSLVVVFETGFPVFYRAERGGYKGKKFKIFKFRSMIKNADKIGGGTTALNDSRITRVGAFLRKTKLDETPQLLNIINGTMSFIGPRPELLKYTNAYDELNKYILGVRPGITDFSSIEFINLDEIVGSDNADEMYEKHVLHIKNRLRVKYVENISFKTDITIFFNTVFKVMKKALGVVFLKNKKYNEG